MRRNRILLFVPILGALSLPCAVESQVDSLRLGIGGLAWQEVGEEFIGLDDAAVAGSLQPFELNPQVNVALGLQTESGQFTNVFGHVWEISGAPPPYVQDITPWVYGSRGRAQTIDGDIDRPTDVAEVSHYSFDMGLPLPLNRVVFFPPDKGRTTTSGGNAGFNRVGSAGLLLKDQYPRQYVVSGSLNEREFLFTGTSNDFDIVVGRNSNQGERIADVRFRTEFLRFLRLRFPALGYIAEVEFYGEGFLPQTRFVSQLFDMGEPVNLGRLFFDFEIYRSEGFGSEPILAPDAPVEIAVEVRSGRDDSPLTYHIVTEIGTEEEVTEKQYNRAPSGTYRGGGKVAAPGGVKQLLIPGQQGSIRDDLTNWSFWSAPHLASGEYIQAPDGRQFVQVRAFIKSQEVYAFGRLNSLSLEFSPLLANPVVGEVALLEEPLPESGVVEVPLGERITLTYDLRADFTSSEQAGFDAVRLRTPEAVDFQHFEMGDPLIAVEPDSLVVDQNELVVYFPSRPVTRADNKPLRLTFETRVFNFNTVFDGEVFQIGGGNLAQSIDGGDASPLVSTNDLQVFAPLERLEILSELELSSGVVTPNSDGTNDVLMLPYTLQGVSSALVEVNIYDLTGRLVRQVVEEMRGVGRYIDVWDGRADGVVVVPGLYFVRVQVDTDLGTFTKTHPVAVAF